MVSSDDVCLRRDRWAIYSINKEDIGITFAPITSLR